MRVKFRNGRLGEVRYAVDIPVGLACGRGRFAAFSMEAETPAPLHNGSLEAPEGQSHFPRNLLTLGELGADVPFTVN